MSFLRSVLALLLVFLMGSPLCCCAAGGGNTETAPGPSTCCSQTGGQPSDERAPDEHVCLCKSKEPRDVGELTVAPQPPLLPLPREAAVAVPPPAVSRTLACVADPLFSGIDPPRALLARFSRWII